MSSRPVPVPASDIDLPAAYVAKAPQGDIPEELNRNLPQVLAEVIQRVNEYEVAALGAALTSALAWRSRSV
jgi:hypothetical protein